VLSASEGAPLCDAPDPVQMRAEHDAGTAALAGTAEPVAAVHEVDGTRVVVPADPHGVVLLLHGGGWVIGSPDSYEHVARILANRSGATVVLPDYRLAPEHPFPAALQDAEVALALSRELAGDAPVAVAGDSAGGQLAAVLARRHRDIVHQALIYPVLDAGRDTGSYRRFATGFRLTADDMAWFCAQYGGDPGDPDLSPLRAPDLSGLPPATIVLASHDVLRDEGEAYARRLRGAGVEVTVRVVEGTVHGFIRWTGVVDLARTALDALGADLRSALRAS
jgi:acetyl esterase